MYARALVVLFIVNVCASPLFADQVVSIENDFGNVKTRIFTSGQCDAQPDKVCIIGELARRLAAELDYTEPIFLDFRCPVGKHAPDYQVSFDNGAIPAIESTLALQAVLESPGIVIRQAGRPLDAAITLTLAEYAIGNAGTIQSEQRPQTYGNQRVNSIDVSQIQEVLGRPMSPTIQRVWQTRVPAPGTRPNNPQNPYGVSYYFENGLFVVHCWNQVSGETPLLSLKDIYDFRELSSSQTVVFDTNKSFHHVEAISARCSRRHIIEDTHDFAGPYEVVPLGGDKLAICFSYFVPLPPGEQPGKLKAGAKVKYRALIYRTRHDDLIQDLDKVFDWGQAKVSTASSE